MEQPSAEAVDAVLFEGDSDRLQALDETVADLEGPIVPVFGAAPDALASGQQDYPLCLLMREHAISTNTAAAGGNASLMTIG